MEVFATAIPDVKIIKPEKHCDRRGFFSETYNKRTLAQVGIHLDFVQDNHSLSVEKGVVRGLHFQTPPCAQHKLVRVVRGAVLDVAVDLRRSSPHFGRHVSVVLTADKWNQLLVPVGFAHGYCTLEPNTELIYKLTAFYSRENDKGLLWNDPELAIPWPVSGADAILSDKDKRLPRLCELQEFFD